MEQHNFPVASPDIQQLKELFEAGPVGPELLTNVFHEMLNRLSVITLTSSMLSTSLEKTLSQDQLEQLGRILHSVDDLCELIHGLVNLTATDEETPVVA